VRNRFGSDHRARAHAIFDHHRDGLDPPDMVRQQARQNIGAASRRERNHDLDRSRRLRLCIPAEQPEEDDGSGSRSELKARKFHCFPPVTMKPVSPFRDFWALRRRECYDAIRSRPP
jgi:hypothetical protein